jgi:hypothetical protein
VCVSVKTWFQGFAFELSLYRYTEGVRDGVARYILHLRLRRSVGGGRRRPWAAHGGAVQVECS